MSEPPPNYCVRCYSEGRRTEIPHGEIGCERCKTANDAEAVRIDEELSKIPTTEGKIAFYQRLMRVRKVVAQTGVPRLITVKDPGARRGQNAKNIRRVLRKGRERLAKATAAGDDLSVLPVHSPIRKQTEARWQRLLKQGLAKGPVDVVTSTDEQGRTVRRYVERGKVSRGSAGRAAIAKKKTTTGRRRMQRSWVLKLLAEGKTEAAVAEQIGISERTVRRYKNGR